MSATAAYDAEALARIADHRNCSDGLILSDAHLFLAFEHGFDGWPEFKRCCRRPASASGARPFATGGSVARHGGDINANSGFGWMPLDYAINRSCINIAEYLRARGGKEWGER